MYYIYGYLCGTISISIPPSFSFSAWTALDWTSGNLCRSDISDVEHQREHNFLACFVFDIIFWRKSRKMPNMSLKEFVCISLSDQLTFCQHSCIRSHHPEISKRSTRHQRPDLDGHQWRRMLSISILCWSSRSTRRPWNLRQQVPIRKVTTTSRATVRRTTPFVSTSWRRSTSRSLEASTTIQMIVRQASDWRSHQEWHRSSGIHGFMDRCFSIMPMPSSTHRGWWARIGWPHLTQVHLTWWVADHHCGGCTTIMRNKVNCWSRHNTSRSIQI